MGHQDQDGEKVRQMSLFDWKFEAAMDREKQKFKRFQVILILTVTVSKIQVSGFRRNLGCALYAQICLFFQNFQKPTF